MDDQPHLPLSAPPREREYDRAEPRPSPSLPRDRLSPPEPRSGWRSALWLLLVLLVAAGTVYWIVQRSDKEPVRSGRMQSTGPMPVGASVVEKGDMPIMLTALGTVTPLAMVTVKTQLNGQLIEVGYKEGQMVKKGDFLAQIDPRPYQVALAQTEAQLAKDQAVLKNSEVDLVRYRTLLSQNSIAKQTADTQAATVQQNRATVQSDQAQIDVQKLNLTYARIVAPISGRVGLRQVDTGNYVQTGDANGIVVITQLQPISVIFTLPEDNLRLVMRRLRTGAVLTAGAYDRTGATKLDTGRLETVDNQIDTSTGTVKLRATFDNPEQILFPNQFVNIQLLLDTLHEASLVPVAAIQRGAPGTFVYLVKPDETVAAQPVKLGPGDSQRIAVTEGVKPGDRVVTDGADRLKEGAKVRVLQSRVTAAPAGAGPGAAPSEEGAAPAAAPSPAAEQPRGQGNGQRRRRGGE
jgi:membrane fusion protein, multidrug efflux system